MKDILIKAAQRGQDFGAGNADTVKYDTIDDMIEAEFQTDGDGWVKISDYPNNGSLKVLRWHHVWKCYVTVSHRRENTANGCEWIDGTLTVVWPEAAFTPFFKFIQPPTH